MAWSATVRAVTVRLRWVRTGTGPAVALPVMAWVGALVGVGPPRWLAVAAAAGATAGRRRWMVVVAVAVLVGSLADDARRGLDGVAVGTTDAMVTLVSDPEPSLGGWRVVVRVDGRRLEVVARGGAGGALQGLLAGETAHVHGRVAPMVATDRSRAAHLAGHLEATTIEPVGPGPPGPALANRLRRTMYDGAASLDPDQRALLLGVVVGDDRDLSPLAVDAVRATGLSHLTAVSGQNVALLLGLLGPFLDRLGLRSRLVGTLIVLGAFVVVTRAEPSVLRAAVTAGAAAAGAATGRPVDGLRALGLAVTALLVIDPLLVHALGFQLSVAATAGILVLAESLTERMPGPRPVAEVVGVSAAAQVAVAPLLLAAGLDVPVVSLPANVVAGPLAGAAMAWGVVAAPLAGWLGEPLATVVHWPSGVLLGLVLAVAHLGTRAGLGSLGWPHWVGIVAGVTLAGWVRPGWVRPGWARPRWVRRLGFGVVVLALGVAALPGPPPSPGRHALGPGAEATVAGSAVVVTVDGRVDAGRLLGAARRLGLDRPDLIVVRSPRGRAVAAAEVLSRRYGGDVLVVGPVGLTGRVQTVDRTRRILVDGLVVELWPVDGGLEVAVPEVEPRVRARVRRR